MKSAIPHSLLKYETPILVSSSYKSQSAQSKRPSSQMSAKPADPSEDYLNKILPPQEISENNQLWVRYVSATPATTFDVTNLAKDLEKQITT
jgi:dynein light intermediate chain, axonemal